MASNKDVGIQVERMEMQAVPENYSDTPAHTAAQLKNFGDLKGQINGNPQCIYKKGASEQTVLHDAVESGDLDIVRFVLDIAKKHPPTEKHPPAEKHPPGFLNQRDGFDFTPLHLVAIHGSVDIAKLLIKDGASVNPKGAKKKGFKTPFHKAAYYGKVELALYLLQQGAVISYQAFGDIIGGGYEKLAKAVIETDQWPLALRGTYKRHEKETTAFRELIAKMPDVAKMVLNRCTVEKLECEPKSNRLIPNPSRDNEKYEVIFNYEFLEDYMGDWTADKCKPIYDKHETCDFDGINKRHDVHARPRIEPWGIETFSKADQPLQIMVNHNRIDLLTHPVVGSLIHYKWKKFGALLYFINLITFCVFLACLTIFVLILPNPQGCVCTGGRNQTVCAGTGGRNQTVCAEHQRGWIITTSIFVLLLVLIRLIYEIANILTQISLLIEVYKDYKKRLTGGMHLLSCVADLVNWIDIALYSCTIAFVISIYVSENFCASSKIWQTGVAAVFLGWTVLILFISKVPVVGIYVIILTRICITYLKMIVLTILMIVTFGLAFYLTFFDPRVMRSSFGDAAISLLKTITMSTGEVGFNSIFRLDSSGDSCEKDEIFFPTISYIVWILFIFFMPVVLINMLTSLAVDDTEKIRADAKLQTLTLQVEQVLSITEFFFTLKAVFKQKKFCCTRIDTIYYRNVKPNEVKKLWDQLLASITFILWGGDHYDNIETLLDVFDPPKNEVLERVIALENDTKDIKDYLQQVQNDMKDIKGYFEKILAKQENPL